MAQKVPVTATPTINALFDITYHKGIVSGIYAAVEQRTEVFPLHVGSVLELIQKEIVKADAQFLIYERRRRAVYDVAEDSIGVVNGDDVFLLLDLREGLLEFRRHAKGIDLVRNDLGR